MVPRNRETKRLMKLKPLVLTTSLKGYLLYSGKFLRVLNFAVFADQPWTMKNVT